MLLIVAEVVASLALLVVAGYVGYRYGRQVETSAQAELAKLRDAARKL